MADAEPGPENAPDENVAPILVVDDDVHVRQAIRWMLEDEGFSVVTAADGREALRCVAQRRPALVVLDMGLPDVEGTQVAAELRKSDDARIPLLVISADGRAAEKARWVGAFAYLHKPFEIEHFIATVRQGLRSR